MMILLCFLVLFLLWATGWDMPASDYVEWAIIALLAVGSDIASAIKSR